jgi:hypothetical protein
VRVTHTASEEERMTTLLDYQMLSLLRAAVHLRDAGALETVLEQNGDLRGTRMNTAMIDSLASMVAQTAAYPNPPVEVLEALLDGWAAITPDDAPVNHPREILPAAAAAAYGQVALARPEWWDDEIAKLQRGAADTRWRVRDTVAAAMQDLLKADWARASRTLVEWLDDPSLYVVRAVAAALAEPRFYKDKAHPQRGIQRAEQALALLSVTASRLMDVPASARKGEDARCLRQALGYSISVPTVSAPDTGFTLLERLAASGDTDARWIVLENLKKTRLNPWLERVQSLQMKLR